MATVNIQTTLKSSTSFQKHFQAIQHPVLLSAEERQSNCSDGRNKCDTRQADREQNRDPPAALPLHCQIQRIRCTAVLFIKERLPHDRFRREYLFNRRFEMALADLFA